MASPLHQTINQIRFAGSRQPVVLQALEEMPGCGRLIDRMRAVALDNSWWRPDTTGGARQAPGTQPPVKQSAILETLSDCARITSRQSELPEPEYSACLELLCDQQWKTVACYEFRRRRSRRYVYRVNGDIVPFEMDLPLSVIREMAREDFSRNWLAYAQEFQRQPAR